MSITNGAAELVARVSVFGIGQGANDARVIQAESEQIVAAIEKNRGSAIYVLYPDEGHGLARSGANGRKRRRDVRLNRLY